MLGPSTSLIGVLMEYGHKDAVITLVSIADGTVSLYFSNGGGMIGLGEYESVRKASIDFLSFAGQFMSNAAPTTNYPFPSKGYITFYFITNNGILFSTAKENDLGNNKLPLSSLFLKGNDVITQARLVDEKRGRDFQQLMHAVTIGDTARVDELLSTLPNPDVSDQTGMTPLMVGAYRGQDRIVQKLLERKATIDQKDSQGYTALMFASNAGKLACVQVLVENGANVNETANDDSTPIMFAAQHGYNDIIRYLLGKGANPELVGKHGLSAVGFARQNHLIETEMILLRKR